VSKTVTVAMISPAYVVTLAAYNRWQNENLFDAAQTLADVERRRDRGAFFGSIHGTLNHILWADEFWMGRLVGRPHPKTPIASPEPTPPARLRRCSKNATPASPRWKQSLRVSAGGPPAYAGPPHQRWTLTPPAARF
jgi:uncharacterized damage-inducible protein DinB